MGEDHEGSLRLGQLGLKPGEFGLGNVRILPVEILALVGGPVAAEAGVKEEEGDAAGLEGVMPAGALRVGCKFFLCQGPDAVVAEDVVPRHGEPGETRLDRLEPFDLALDRVGLVDEVAELDDEVRFLDVQDSDRLVEFRQGLSVKAGLCCLLVGVVQVGHQADPQDWRGLGHGRVEAAGPEPGEGERSLTEKGAAGGAHGTDETIGKVGRKEA